MTGSGHSPRDRVQQTTKSRPDSPLSSTLDPRLRANADPATPLRWRRSSPSATSRARRVLRRPFYTPRRTRLTSRFAVAHPAQLPRRCGALGSRKVHADPARDGGERPFQRDTVLHRRRDQLHVRALPRPRTSPLAARAEPPRLPGISDTTISTVRVCSFREGMSA